MMDIDVFYNSPRGASIGRVFHDEPSLVAFVSRLRKPAVILVKGVHVGKVFKTESGWGWFYEPEKVTPNNACSGLAVCTCKNPYRDPYNNTCVRCGNPLPANR
jgi:hypothetical protein